MKTSGLWLLSPWGTLFFSYICLLLGEQPGGAKGKERGIGDSSQIPTSRKAARLTPVVVSQMRGKGLSETPPLMDLA